jgi:type I restriction enzyme M protein
LVPSKYIEFIDHDLEIDYPKEMARIQQEMKELMQREKDSQIMLAEAFKGIGYEIE